MFTLLFLASAAGLFTLLLLLDFLIYQRPPAWVLLHLLSPVTAEGTWVAVAAFGGGLVSAVVRDLRRTP